MLSVCVRSRPLLGGLPPFEKFLNENYDVSTANFCVQARDYRACTA
jgi:hypothetical protein